MVVKSDRRQLEVGNRFMHAPLLDGLVAAFQSAETFALLFTRQQRVQERTPELEELRFGSPRIPRPLFTSFRLVVQLRNQVGLG